MACHVDSMTDCTSDEGSGISSSRSLGDGRNYPLMKLVTRKLANIEIRSSVPKKKDGFRPKGRTGLSPEPQNNGWGYRRRTVAPNTWRMDTHRVERLRVVFAEARLAQITSAAISDYQIRRLEEVKVATINSE